MYELTQESFGDFEKFILKNEVSGNGFSLIPESGGTVLELWLAGKQILDGCASPQELGNNIWYKSALLFPFPNRLKDGRYELMGDGYEFEINDSTTGNALHGFGRDVKMDVFNQAIDEKGASITLSYFYEGQHEAYPFPFLLDITYKISDSAGFELEMKLTNESDELIPIGLGWHPYFDFGIAVDELELQLPACKLIEVDEKMIPTGDYLQYDYFKKQRSIGKAVLDNGFVLNEPRGIREVIISNGERNYTYWQQAGSEQYNFLQIFTPGNRKAIAIEPMTCNIDAFNNKKGLIMLAPERFVQVRCGIR